MPSSNDTATATDPTASDTRAPSQSRRERGRQQGQGVTPPQKGRLELQGGCQQDEGDGCRVEPFAGQDEAEDDGEPHHGARNPLG